MTTKTIIESDIAALRPRLGNPRSHSPKQIRQIADSIRVFGFTNPVLVDGEFGIIAGHGRVAAARLLGMAQVPTIRLDHMSEAEIRAYVIADNRLAELAGWDQSLLAIEFSYLETLDLDFDLGVIGFETGEIDLIIGAAAETAAPDPADEQPPVGPPVCRPGDLWQLGPHRLLCGDARAAADLDRLMTGELADMVFTDPPYNVTIQGHVCGLGATRHAEFAMASGEMTAEAFTAFLEETLGQLASHSRDGSIHFVCMDWRHLAELLAAGGRVYDEVKNLCVWVKHAGGMGSLYRSQHELILVFKKGRAPHANNIQLGRFGRNRTNVWSYPGVNCAGAERAEARRLHPTVKPVALVADAIRDCSPRGGLILDSFAGSGTVLLAAERTGRQARALEITPTYVDTAIRRWQAMTGQDARREDGLRFADLEMAISQNAEDSHVG